MRLVPRYTLVLGSTLAIVLAVVAYVRVQVTRDQLEYDMRRDHRVVGRTLEVGVADIWAANDPTRATRQTIALLDRSSREAEATRFEWSLDGASVETQRREGSDFVSRFPVTVGQTQIGTIVAREPLAHLDEIVDTEIVSSILGVAAIIIVCGVASLAMGSWLVGRPVGVLVEQARRIGRRDFSVAATSHRSDELGALAHELRRAADALAESISRSAAEAEARLAAVEQMRHSDRLATVGKLAAGIAHELGTPLSVVGGHAQMIATREVAGDAALASARAIDAEVTRMGKIVRQLLDFARRKGPEGKTCRPTEVAKRCIGLLLVMAERQGVRCTVHESDAQALIDEDNLQQVLTNLCVNAIQAMPNGGDLTVRITRAKNHVRVDVSDTGTGIAPEVEAHLFEPFFTTKQPGDGTGLGLAVVHGIVLDHHGWIDVETSDRGTTFSLYLQEVVS